MADWEKCYATSFVTAREWFNCGAKYVVCKISNSSLIVCFDIAESQSLFDEMGGYD